MDNFNYQAYIKSGKIHGDKAILTESEQVSEKKYKQGYDDREDESLGDRTGAEKGKKQSMKDRRDDSYGKFGKRDAEKKGKNKINKESIQETIFEAKAKIDEGSYPFDQCLSDNEGKYGEEGAKKVCGFIKAQYGEGIVYEGDPDAAARGLENIINGISKVLNKSKEWVEKNVDVGSMQKAMSESEQVKEDSISGEDDYAEDLSDKMRMKEDARTDAEEEGYKDGMKDEKADLQKEDARTDAEQEGYKDGFDDAKDDVKDALSKMKVSELKAKIRENILSTLNEEEEVDVDIDVEDEVEVEAGADDIEIERPGVKTTVDVGLSPEEEIVQDSLKAAMDAAQALGSQKLADQIGNTITFFTREFVVGQNTD